MRLWVGKVSWVSLERSNVTNRAAGKKDGQVLMIKNNGVVEAYQVYYVSLSVFAD